MSELVLVATETDEDLVEQAKTAAAEADEAEAEAGSPHRWKQADSYYELSQRGWSGKQIAEACGVSESTVSRFKKTILRYRNADDRPVFWHAYAEITGERSGASPAKNEPDPSIDGRIMEILEEARKLIPKWEASLVDPHKPRQCRRRVEIASEISAWLAEEFVPAHDAKLTPLPTAPAGVGGY